MNVTGSGLKRKNRRTTKRAGYLVPLLTGRLTATASIVQAWKNIKNSKRVLRENERQLERILKEKKALNLVSGSGLKSKRKGKKCRKNKISFL